MLPALLVVKEHRNGLIKPINTLADLIDFTATKPFLSIAAVQLNLTNNKF
jgi:hypothetical protein